MKDFQCGLLATLPLAPGVVAFGLLYGVMARQVGFSPWEAWAMSLIIHAGSAQFTALGMWKTAGAAPIILTTLVINLHHMLLGASVAPHLRDLSAPWKALQADTAIPPGVLAFSPLPVNTARFVAPRPGYSCTPSACAGVTH